MREVETRYVRSRTGCDVFVQPLAAAAEGAGMRRSRGGQRVERPHVDADQLLGGDADEIGQRAIDAQNVVLLVVHHDEVADGIEDFQPMAVGLLHAGKQAGIFQRDAGMAGDGAQQLAVGHGGRSAAVGEAQHAGQFARRARQTHQRAIAPSQTRGERASQHVAGRGEYHVRRVFRQGRAQRLTEAPQHGLVFDLDGGFAAAREQDGIGLRRLKKAEGGGAASQQGRGALREVAHELGQMQHGVDFERDGRQGLGAAAVLLGLVQVPGEFERDGCVRRQSAGPAYVFLVDRPRLDAVEHAKHPQHIAVRPEQGNGEKLADMERFHELQIHVRSLCRVLDEEHLFILQGAGRGAVVQRDIERPGGPVFRFPSNVEGGLFEQSDEAAFEAQKTGRAHHRGPHELVQFPGAAEFEGNLENFVQFLRLGAGHAVQLGVGDGDRAKSSQG